MTVNSLVGGRELLMVDLCQIFTSETLQKERVWEHVMGVLGTVTRNLWLGPAAAALLRIFPFSPLASNEHSSLAASAASPQSLVKLPLVAQL